MADSVIFHEKEMNITTAVNPDLRFFCSCNWSGFATELAKQNDYSCCPSCGDFDVRMSFEFFDWTH